MQESNYPELERYQISTDRGESPAWKIFQAFDPQESRQVVLQILKSDFPEAEAFKNKSIQMAQVALRWRHSGLVRLLDFNQEGDFYLVWEDIPGSNLRQMLITAHQQKEWPTLSEVVQLARQIGLAIDYLHQRGIPHGAVIPENIVIKPEISEGLPYRPVLLAPGFSGLQPLNLQGLAAYLPPERTHQMQADTPGDIYSLGVLLYELAVSQLPIISGTTGFPSARLLRPDLPVSLERVLQKALMFNPEDRYSDIGLMNRALLEANSEALTATGTPPGIKNTVSLLTIYQNNLNIPQTPSPDDEKAQEPSIEQAPPAIDRIYIIEPDQTTHHVSIPSTGLTIGRDPKVEIHLDHAGVSRHHARVEFDGEVYRVTDLGSKNGTFLGDKKLNPKDPTPWHPDEHLHIGESTLHLELAEQVQPTTYTEIKPAALQETQVMVTRLDGSTIDDKQIYYSQDKKWVGVAIESTNLSITPGGHATLSFVLLNHGPQGDTFQLALSGIAPDWIDGQSLAVSVPVGSQREVHLSIRPPRSPNTRAGRLPAILKVTSRNDPSQAVEIRLAITIAAFSQFAGELKQQQMIAAETNQVSVYNQGNLPENFSLTWESPAQTLIFEPSQARLTIPQGQSGNIEFRATLAQPRWFGADQESSYMVHITPSAGPKQTLQGQLTSRNVLPTWIWVGLGSLLVVTACITMILLGLLLSDGDSSGSGSKASTGTAQAIYAAVAATETAAAAINAGQATSQAVTATAAWQMLDADQDGLTNIQEIQNTTDINNPDTDADGLKDGEELTVWSTYPLTPDSDGDGLKDGEEIQRGTHPLKRDTDGDGLDDGSDPDPVHFPTATLIPTFTSTAQPSTTPTTSSTPQILTADLVVSISNNQTTSVPGANTAYTLIVTNRGPGNIVGARLSNTPPEALQNTLWSCSPSPGARCYIPTGQGAINIQIDLPVNGTVTFTSNGNLNPSAAGILVNSASIELPPGMNDPNTVDNLALDTDTLTPRVSLVLSKTDGLEEIAPGQSTSYTINVTNNGPSTAAGVTIIDTFPETILGVTWTCGASTGSTCAIPGPRQGSINATVDLLPGGYATFTANGNVAPNAQNKIVNTVYLTSPIDPNTNNQSISDSTTVISQADLLTQVIAPQSVAVNTIFTYTINIANNGPLAAQGVRLNNTLPDQVEFISASPALSCTRTNTTVTCNLGEILAGNGTQVYITVRSPAAPAVLINQATASAEQPPDPDSANNQVTTTVQVN